MTNEPVLISEGVPDLLSSPPRSDGVHQSVIINDICLIHGHHSDKDSESEGRGRMRLGQALEKVIILDLNEKSPDRYVVLGELVVDGVYLTPDLYDTFLDSPYEIKLTWMSATHELRSQKLWRYEAQLKTYCHAMGSSSGQLDITYINHWPDPLRRHWHIPYSRRELSEHWTFILRHRDRMIKEGRLAK